MGIIKDLHKSLLLFIVLLCCLKSICQGLTSDGEALVNFRTSIVSSVDVLGQWRPEDPDPCGWKGVTCDPKTMRVISLNVSHHKLKGPLSPDIGKLDQLQFLDLHYNNFYGPIPPELGNCTELQGLFLQNNYLSGFIPVGLGNLSKLQTLDISSNSLDGRITTSIGTLMNLSNLNVSFNFLSGPIPTDGILSKFGSDSFVGNSDLCGQQINKLCKDEAGNQQPAGSQNAKKNSGRLLISACATISALLLVALMCFWGCFLYKRLGKNDAKGIAKDVIGGASIVMFHGDLPYSSKDIIKKLETLNEEHVIGAGGFGTVYKLAMDDGNVFALKRIVKLNEGFDRFFERELAILGSIKHKYLVNLRGYCNSPTSKLLLYDYLPGGNLDEALHGTISITKGLFQQHFENHEDYLEKGEQLDWDARLKIIMGAAKGLAYLHHDCSPRVIHRDIKASNILLDGNMEARVSDFGLAKLLEDEESHITTIVAGTFGYLAPEYMQSGRATEKTDVYSFGVLMLEVVSRKRPTDASFIEKGLNIVGWLNYLVAEDRQREIIDENCEGVEAETLDPLLSVVIQCVSSSPEDRPTMHTVVKTLESDVMTPCPSEFYDSSSD